MALVATAVSFRGDDGSEDISTITEKNAKEGEQCAQVKGDIKSRASSSDTTRDKRKRYSESCDAYFDYSDNSSDEEDERAKKRIPSDEEEGSSDDDYWGDYLLKDSRQRILEEMREKEKKLKRLRCSQKRKVQTITSTTLAKVKEELEELRVMYEQLSM